MDEPIDSTPVKIRQLRQITERRPCLSCGYDLRGQPVWREEHYGWYITRCTECGFVSPMGSFDMTAKILRVSAGRAAGFWFIFNLILWTTMGGIMFAMSRTGMVALASGGGATALAGFAILWMIVVATIGGLLSVLFSSETPTKRFMWMGMPVLLVTMLWWAHHVMTEMRDPFTDAISFENSILDDGGIVRLLIMLGVQASILVAVYLPMRAIVRFVCTQFAPQWVGATQPGLWQADGLELPERFGGEKTSG